VKTTTTENEKTRKLAIAIGELANSYGGTVDYTDDWNFMVMLEKMLVDAKETRIEQLEHFVKMVLDDVVEYCPNLCESEVMENDCPDNDDISCNFADYYHEARKLLGMDKNEANDYSW